VQEGSGFMHGHTYSANPVACAVGRAVLKEYTDQGLIGNAAEMGLKLKLRLESLLEDYPFIGEVRGKGLLLAFDVVGDRESGRPLPPEFNAHLKLAQEAYERGLIIYSRRVMSGKRGDHFLVTPPLTITEAEIDEIMDLLVQALDAFTPGALKAMKA
jgi:adenosylmethionine-8-amino-7-oxononanoate aminotransferase